MRVLRQASDAFMRWLDWNKNVRSLGLPQLCQASRFYKSLHQGQGAEEFF
ncbi:hypothetical protein AB3R30_18805 [Leptolyngbyaceae cyanobacterium UHCC 1019]